MTTQPIEASAFAASLGVNAHLTWTSTAYGDVTSVEHALDYLGVSNVRDIGGYSFPVYDTMAKAGYHFDFTTIGGSQQQDPSVFSQWLHNFATAHPGAIKSIEGPNEVNIWGVNYGGQTGAAGAVAYQTALFNKLSADPTLNPIPVYNMSVASDAANDYNGLGDMSGVADVGTLHPYAINGNQPNVQLSAQLAWAQVVTPNKPLAITEVGYPTVSTDYWQGVDENTQAKLTLSTVLDAAKLGVASTYLYELVDNNVSSGGGAWSKGGLFHSDWSPKPAATALHNLTTVLGTGSGATPTAAAPDYTVTGLSGYNASLSLHEANGAYDIVVWREPDIWDATTHAPIAAAAQTATINLTQAVGGYAVYDPLVGTAPVATGGATSQITLSLTDHPLVVELQGSAASTPPSTPTPAPTPTPTPTGEAANDTILGAETPNSIHGGGGDDLLTGGGMGDIINGNTGADTVHGAGGGDTLSGGQGYDIVLGDDGSDLVIGNLGSDTLHGGLGADTIRGGQGDDALYGGAGDDWLSGDLGNDTLTGGAGADTFHAFAGGGVDVVLDFNPAQGDRVQLDPGASYQLHEQDGSVVVDLGGGAELIVRNVSLAALPAGWIVS